MIQGNNVRNVSVLLTPFQQVARGWGFNHCGIVASADSHTAAGKMGGFPPANLMGQIYTVMVKQSANGHQVKCKWVVKSDAITQPGKMGRFPYRHVCSLCYPWIVQLSGSLVVWRSVPVTGRVRPLTRSTAPRPEGGPPFPRAGARRPLRTTVGDVRQLRGGGLGYGFAGRGWAGRYGQRCGFRRFAAGARLTPAWSPSMP
jgi:hypothetical protein